MVDVNKHKTHNPWYEKCIILLRHKIMQETSATSSPCKHANYYLPVSDPDIWSGAGMHINTQWCQVMQKHGNVFTLHRLSAVMSVMNMWPSAYMIICFWCCCWFLPVWNYNKAKFLCIYMYIYVYIWMDLTKTRPKKYWVRTKAIFFSTSMACV